MHHRIARHIAAADVQKPGNAVGKRQHHGRMPRPGQCAGQPPALVACGLARQNKRLDHHPTGGRRRLPGPDRINKIGHGLQPDVAARQPQRDLVDLFRRMQPRIEPDHPRCQSVADPVPGLHLGPGHRGEGRQIHLRLDLRAVTPVDENPRHLRQHDAEPRRSGKPGQPLQPFVMGGDIFALMGIGARHDEACKPRLGHARPQRRQPARASLRIGGALEALEHHALHPSFSLAKISSGVQGGRQPPCPASVSPRAAGSCPCRGDWHRTGLPAVPSSRPPAVRHR